MTANTPSDLHGLSRIIMNADAVIQRLEASLTEMKPWCSNDHISQDQSAWHH